MDNQIVFLKGAERVRRRPAVVFGDVGDTGAMNSVERMIHILAAYGGRQRPLVRS